MPLVICLSYRFSHARLSISIVQPDCGWLIKSVIVYLIDILTWITVVILELIHAKNPDFSEGMWLLAFKTDVGNHSLLNHNNLRIIWPRAVDQSIKFLPYQLWMVMYWITMVVTGNGELGFDSGEGAWEMATTSKEGSRRANYPILIQGGSDKK